MISSEDLELPFFFMLLFLFFGIAIKLFGVELNMDAGDWIQLFGIGVSIIVAAYVLGRQLNKINKQIELQNDQLIAQNKQITMQHFSDYTKRYQEIMLQLPEEINDDDFGLEELEKGYHQNFKQIKRSLRTYFDLCYEEWALMQNNLIEPASWTIWESGMQTAMSRKVFREFWLEEVNIDTEYGESFHTFLSDLTSTQIAKNLVEKRKLKAEQKANKKLLNPQPSSTIIPMSSEKKADEILR